MSGICLLIQNTAKYKFYKDLHFTNPVRMMAHNSWIHHVLLVLLDNIILHTNPNDVALFWIWNHHLNIPIYQLPLTFNVDLPPKGTNFPFLPIILHNNILPIIVPIIWKNYICIQLKFRVSLFPQIILQCIHQYIFLQNIHKYPI